MNPLSWPRWLIRALRPVIENEIRDMTRPGDTHPYMLPTGRQRLIIRGVPLPWRPFRRPGAFQPVNTVPGFRGEFT